VLEARALAHRRAGGPSIVENNWAPTGGIPDQRLVTQRVVGWSSLGRVLVVTRNPGPASSGPGTASPSPRWTNSRFIVGKW